MIRPIKGRRRIVRSAAFLLTIGLIVTTQRGYAAPWEFEAIVDVGVIYTDNIRLVEEGAEETEFIYIVAPQFSLRTEGDRLQADINYSPQALFYSDTSDADDVYQTLDASVTGTLIRGALFVEARAASYQSIVTPEATIPTSNIPISANRTDANVFELRPYWDQNLGFADILVETFYGITRYDTGDDLSNSLIQDNDQTGAKFELNNHERGEGVAWGLDYQFRKVEYDDATPFEIQQASANLGYWFGSRVRLFALGGVETPFDDYFDSSMDDEFWEAGIELAPSSRLNLELAAGERSFGEAYRLDLTYELRRGNTRLYYTEEPSTRAEIWGDFGPLAFSGDLNNFFDRPTDSDRFVRKYGEWYTTIETGKSEIALRLYLEDREQRTTDVGTDLEDERLTGGSFLWRWNFGDNSSLSLTADIAEREVQQLADELTRVTIEYSFQFSPRFGVALAALQSRQDGENSQFNEYTENQFRVLLRGTL